MRIDMPAADHAVPLARQIRVGLIGAGIQQSKSPPLHTREAALHGLDYSYELFDLAADGLTSADLPALLARAEARGFAGLNITHPCKQVVLPLLSELSADARALGAVNTVVFRGGARIGHNTDWSGFYENFSRGLPEVARRQALLLGAGGAGVAVAHAALKLGIERLAIADLEAGRAAQLANALNDRFGAARAYPTTDVAGTLAMADGLIHATPTGMAQHPGLPLDAALLEPRHWVADIVYVPLVTPLLVAARARGCRTLDGGGMAVFQAIGALRLFAGIEPDAERMIRHFASLVAPA